MGGTQPKNWNGQFSDKKWAIMFLPGVYPLNIRIGYYTSIIGLGQTPNDVVITGNIVVEDSSTNWKQEGLSNFTEKAKYLIIVSIIE